MVETRNISGQQNQPQYTMATINTQQRQLVPTNFVALESQRRNNIGNAEDFGKPGYERYYFFHENNGYCLDINLELMGQLGLIRNHNCEHIVYVDKEILVREIAQRVITIDDVEDIILIQPGTIPILEREAQTDLTGQRISELENNLAEQRTNFQELNERINALQEENTQTRERLTQERDDLQGRLNETNNEINDLNQQNNNLQTNLINEQNARENAERQLNQVQQELQRITTERNEARENLQVIQQQLQDEQNARQQTQRQLADTNSIINDLTDQKNNLQGTINSAQTNLRVNDLAQLPAMPQGQNLQNLINFYNNTPQDWQQQINNRPDITVNEYNQLVQDRDNLRNQRDNWSNHVCYAPLTTFVKGTTIFRCGECKISYTPYY